MCAVQHNITWSHPKKTKALEEAHGSVCVCVCVCVRAFLCSDLQWALWLSRAPHPVAVVQDLSLENDKVIRKRKEGCGTPTHSHTHTHTHTHIHIPLPHTPHDVWLPAACVWPCEIPQTLMKSIDVECGDIRVATRVGEGGREKKRGRKGQRHDEERETASKNRKKGKSIKQTNQKFTQTSITTQSRIKINKIITTEHKEIWTPTQAHSKRGTHTHTHAHTQTYTCSQSNKHTWQSTVFSV